MSYVLEYCGNIRRIYDYAKEERGSEIASDWPQGKEERNPAGGNAVEFLKKVRENRSPFPKFGDFLLVCTPAEE